MRSFLLFGTAAKLKSEQVPLATFNGGAAVVNLHTVNVDPGSAAITGLADKIVWTVNKGKLRITAHVNGTPLPIGVVTTSGIHTFPVGTFREKLTLSFSYEHQEN